MTKFENMINYVNEVYKVWNDSEDMTTPRPVKTVTDKIFDKDGNVLNIEFSLKYGDEDTRTGDEQLFKVEFYPQGDYVLTGDIVNQLVNEIKSLSSNDWIAFEPGEGVVYESGLTVASEVKLAKETHIRNIPVEDIPTGISHDINFMFRNDIVTAGIITNHIEETMYTKYDYETWKYYFQSATIRNQNIKSHTPHIRSGYELRLHDATKDPGLHSLWIWSCDIYDKPRCESLAKEIRKRLAKSQLHQDFEKVEINVVSHPNELDDGDDVDIEYKSHISIYINASVPKSSFKFKHNLTNLKDLSSFEDFDRDNNGQKVEPSATELLLNAIRERDEEIARKEAERKAKEEADRLAAEKAERERQEAYDKLKNFLESIGDFELHGPSSHDPDCDEAVAWLETMCSRIVPFKECWRETVSGFYIGREDLRGLSIIHYGYGNFDENVNNIIKWMVENGAKEPEHDLV